MSLLPRRAASLPGPSGSLCALLALLQLLTLPGPLASAPAGPSGIIVSELRCVCLTPTHRIRPQMIHHLEMVPAGPGCPNVEIIAMLKNGKEICLDPNAPVIKKIVQKILEGVSIPAASVENERYAELRCTCTTTTSGIHPRNFQILKVSRAGPHCPNVEVIATLKNGKEICLDPNARLLKKIVQKILEGDESAA
ncbi:C-X-C motif chemokine 6-like isoform X2 [Myotis myotis]|uniref:C-X-C motif chemokine 6-like isoform X2 n=1 Tax=Myotis myotis TaxID=51298 RepID=UPI00174AF4F5|nr:C-X-C motif chemokine 6-like isoform X2 [Myotis myotis]